MAVVNSVSIAKSFNQTYDAVKKDQQFKDYKKTSKACKEQAGVLLKDNKLDPESLAKEVEKHYGEKLAKKIREWAKKWKLPETENKKITISDSFETAAKPFENNHGVLEGNKKYQAFRIAKKIFRIEYEFRKGEGSAKLVSELTESGLSKESKAVRKIIYWEKHNK